MWYFIEPVNKAGDTPLSLACASGHLDTAKYLVNEYQCDPRSKYNYCMAHQLLITIYNYVQVQSTRRPLQSGATLVSL